eukprot:Skav204756  [mRNA]  locus=scaffold1013:221397:230009:- [translate_table: standard]
MATDMEKSDPVRDEEIKICFDTLRDDADARAVLLSGAGRLFCAGLDLQDAMTMFGSDSAQDIARRALKIRTFGKAWQDAFTSIEFCGKAVIACMHGAALGVALEMVCACDIRFCTEETVFQLAEVNLGLASDVGGLQRLPKIIGNQKLAVGSRVSQELSSDSAQKLVPRNPDGTEQGGKRGSIGGNKAPAVGTGAQRCLFSMMPSRKIVNSMFPDFDVYLSEALMPVLAQAVDDFFHLKGALKDSKMVEEDILKGGQSRTSHRRGSLGGDAVTFDTFWFKMANVIVKHDGILWSTIQEGRRLQKLREEEQVRALEAAKREEERRQKEAKENEKLNGAFSALHPRLSEDQALKSILDGKVLTGEFLKPSDPEFASQVAPHGPHVVLLVEFMQLMGLETRSEKDDLASLEVEEAGQRLFRHKVHHQEEESEIAEVEKDDKAKDKRQKAGKRPGKGSKEEPRDPSPSKRGSKEDPVLVKRGSTKEDTNVKRGSKDEPSLVKRGSKEEMGKRGSKETQAGSLAKRGSTKEEPGGKPGSKQGAKDEAEEIVLAACGAERTGIVEAEASL